MHIDAKVIQPPELVGQWARFGPDTAWRDTIDLLPNGQARGWDGQATPDTGRWAVVSMPRAAGLCIGAPSKPNCQTYRLEGDTLVIGRLPHQSYLRRVR